LRLSTIGYELLMSFLMCLALSCVLRTVISHSILLSYLLFFLSTILSDHSIGLLTLDHSIGLFLRNHSIGFHNMPVTTRSMAKRSLQCSSICSSSSLCLPCMPADSDLPSSSVILDTSDSSLDLPELIDQSSAVDSSTERDGRNSLWRMNLKFQTLVILKSMIGLFCHSIFVIISIIWKLQTWSRIVLIPHWVMVKRMGLYHRRLLSNKITLRVRIVLCRCFI